MFNFFSIYIAKDNNTGLGSISVTNCQGSISNVDLLFHGGWAWLYNFFRGIVGNAIKVSLNSQVSIVSRLQGYRTFFHAQLS